MLHQTHLSPTHAILAWLCQALPKALHGVAELQLLSRPHGSASGLTAASPGAGWQAWPRQGLAQLGQVGPWPVRVDPPVRWPIPRPLPLASKQQVPAAAPCAAWKADKAAPAATAVAAASTAAVAAAAAAAVAATAQAAATAAAAAAAAAVAAACCRPLRRRREGCCQPPALPGVQQTVVAVKLPQVLPLAPAGQLAMIPVRLPLVSSAARIARPPAAASRPVPAKMGEVGVASAASLQDIRHALAPPKAQMWGLPC
mmetsp:Transcript_98370/g.219675  ORF Transcript_98370/g.219675 Transcript_98370/m.219675 type:complete len:257 (-) Transcript_98370:562-1332(-)